MFKPSSTLLKYLEPQDEDFENDDESDEEKDEMKKNLKNKKKNKKKAQNKTIPEEPVQDQAVMVQMEQ